MAICYVQWEMNWLKSDEKPILVQVLVQLKNIKEI